MKRNRMDGEEWPGEGRADHSVAEPGIETGARDDRSIAQLVRELTHEASTLVQQEVALAKAEMEEKLTAYQEATAAMAVGGALLFASFLVLLWAANMGLTALFAQWMGVDVAAWLAPVVLGLILGMVGYASYRGGRSRMRGEGLMPQKTKRSLEQDRDWARSRANRIREKAHHG